MTLANKMIVTRYKNGTYGCYNIENNKLEAVVMDDFDGQKVRLVDEKTWLCGPRYTVPELIVVICPIGNSCLPSNSISFPWYFKQREALIVSFNSGSLMF